MKYRDLLIEIGTEELPPKSLLALADAFADGVVGGVVSDIWIDRSETVIRYLEVTLPSGGAVLLPMPLSQVDARLRRVWVQSVLGSQFAHAPRLANPDQVTLREEDQIAAYFASGHLFAEPSRMEPLI